MCMSPSDVLTIRNIRAVALTGHLPDGRDGTGADAPGQQPGFGRGVSFQYESGR